MYISKKTLVITFIVVMILFAGVSYFTFSKVSLKKESNTPQVSTTKDEVIEKEKVDEKKEVEETIPKTEEPPVKKQTDMVEYFNELDNTVFTEENIRKFGKKAKEKFIEITDFVFYGTAINGVTFDGLKDTAKLKIMNILLAIDAKMEKVYPGYKEEIKLKATNLKEKVVIKYLEVSDKVCTSVGEDACNQAKTDFKTMKKSFGLTFDFIKIIGKAGLSKLKDWYEVFRET